MNEAFGQILDKYLQVNKDLPDHIIVFRDGVGDSQRKKVMEIEFPYMIDCIKSKYNALSYPDMTQIIVNKRIN